MTSLRFYFLNVGQGDTTVVITPHGRAIVIDCANFNKTDSLLRILNIKKIDLLVTTHPHYDHVCDVPLLMKKYKVELWWAPGPFMCNSPLFGECYGLAENGNRVGSYEAVVAGSYKRWPGDVECRVLAPSIAQRNSVRRAGKREQSNSNHTSIVVRIGFDKRSGAVLSADGEMFTWSDIVRECIDEVRCKIFKVPHHGSLNGMFPQLYGTMKCRDVVISCGRKNKYRHPHKITMLTLHSLKKKPRVWMTSHSGTIRCHLKRGWARSDILELGDRPRELITPDLLER